VVREEAGAGEDWSETGSPPPQSEFDAGDMDRYFRTRDDLASVAESEPVPGAVPLAYGLRHGHGRAQVRVHHARVPESVDAYARRRHAYAHRE